MKDPDEILDSASGEPSGSPVFVDGSGRRRRWLRRFGYAGGAVCLAYVGMLGVSLVGGPVTPHGLLPLPGVPRQAVQQEEPKQARLTGTGAGPSTQGPVPRLSVPSGTPTASSSLTVPAASSPSAEPSATGQPTARPEPGKTADEPTKGAAPGADEGTDPGDGSGGGQSAEPSTSPGGDPSDGTDPGGDGSAEPSASPGDGSAEPSPPPDRGSGANSSGPGAGNSSGPGAGGDAGLVPPGFLNGLLN